MNFCPISDSTLNRYINLDNIKEIKFTEKFRNAGSEVTKIWEQKVRIWYLGEVACEDYWLTERTTRNLRDRIK